MFRRMFLPLFILLLFNFTAVLTRTHDYNFMHCNHGTFINKTQQGIPLHCLCDKGWDGVDCGLCKTDEVCPEGKYCDKTILSPPNSDKALNCTVTEFFIPSVTVGAIAIYVEFISTNISDLTDQSFNEDEFYLEEDNYIRGAAPGHISAEKVFRRTSGNLGFFNSEGTPALGVNGTGFLEVYAEPHGGPLYLNCTVGQCAETLIAQNTLQVNCQQTSCHATGMVSELPRFIIDHLTGLSTIECNTQTQACSFANTALPQGAKFACQAAGCTHRFVPPAPPKPPPSYLWAKIVGPILGCLLLGGLIALFFVFLAWRERRLNENWKALAHIGHGETVLTWNNIRCTLSTGRVILKDVSGTAYPGRLTAILGASGAGKTTLIDVLAHRKNTGKISGEILINGEAPTHQKIMRAVGYVLQDDKMIGTLTVREHLRNIALLRLPSAMPYTVKMEKVEAVLEDLGIVHIGDSFIGTELQRGISGGEKRRLSIASELITDPAVLFLDEPTSGLDSSTAFGLMKTLQTLAVKSKRTVVMSIHQPSSTIYHLFDDVMLLGKGHICYYGPAKRAVDFFSENDFECPKTYNPADFMLELVTENENGAIKKLAESYLQSVYHTQMTKKVSVQSTTSEMDPLEAANYKKLYAGAYASPFYTQVWVLTKRTWLNNYRNPLLFQTMYLVTALIAFGLGNLYWKVTPDLSGVQNRIGVFFFMVVLLSFAAMSAIVTFHEERPVFVRERAAGMYNTASYFIAKTISDFIPMRVIPALILIGTAYYMIGLKQGLEHFAWACLAMVLASMAAGSFCLMISAIFENLALANLVAILGLLFFLLFGGFLLNSTSMPSFIGWMNYLSFINYTIEVLMVNELMSTTIYFNPKGINTNAVIAVRGEVFLDNFSMNQHHWNRDFIMLAVWIVIYLAASYASLRWIVKERR